jgi:hypothetical protein
MHSNKLLQSKEDNNYENTQDENSSGRFEKIYLNISELKGDSLKSLEVFSSFYKEYLENNNNINTKEISEFLRLIENNKNTIKLSKIFL